jgi:hypothetical protein
MGIFKDLYDQMEAMERRAWQVQLAQFQPDENGMVRFPYRETSNPWAPTESASKENEE